MCDVSYFIHPIVLRGAQSQYGLGLNANNVTALAQIASLLLVNAP